MHALKKNCILVNKLYWLDNRSVKLELPNPWHQAACCLTVAIPTFQIYNCTEESLKFNGYFIFFISVLTLFHSFLTSDNAYLWLLDYFPIPSQLIYKTCFSHNSHFYHNHQLLCLLACMWTSNKYFLFLGHDCSIRLWNMDNKTCVQEITSHRKKFDEAIFDVAFHPSKPYIASAGADALAKVFV